jgi:GMP synthase-like glutamine amidotransferase
VRDCHRHPALEQERVWLARRARLDLPTLGICFGAQLLAHVLGAGVSRNPVMEIGGYEVRLTDAGRSDPLLAGFGETFPVFHWHGDTFALPAGADLLVEGSDCRHQMFRLGRLVGVQFHVEITVPMARRWTTEYAHELEKAGKSADRVVAECRDRADEMTALAELFMDNLMGGIG